MTEQRVGNNEHSGDRTGASIDAHPSTSAKGKSGPTWGAWVVRHRKSVLTGAALAFLGALFLGSGARSALSLSRFESPGAESQRAAHELSSVFETGAPNVTLLVTAREGTIDEPSVVRAGRELVNEVRGSSHVAEVRSYWTDGDRALVSEDRKHALVLVRLPGSATETRGTLSELSPEWTRETDAIRVGVGGGDEVFRQVGAQAGRDFVRAEMVIYPVILILLALVFRSAVAALLPLMVGLIAIVGTLATLRVLATLTEVSTFALNLTLVLGLGLGVDYGLLVIARFRELRRDGASLTEAAAVTSETAGRTVLFSGVTVAVSLLAMLLFPFPFLRSFAYAGVAVVGFGVLGAAVVLPSLLSFVGKWIPKLPKARQDGGGMWHRMALIVMDRPFILGGSVLLLLLLLGAPFLQVRFGLPDDRVLPDGTSSREVQEVIREAFVVEEMDALLITASDMGAPASRLSAIQSYAESLSEVPGISHVESYAGSFADGAFIERTEAQKERFASSSGVWFSAIPRSSRLESDPLGLVDDVRAVAAPFSVAVGGYPADLADYRSVVLGRLPIVLGVIFLATFIILFLLTGSVFLPVKATVLNLLSLCVMFGSLVFVFQQGFGADLLGFTPTGSLETSIPILMFCVCYGLSMDYEVFLLARMKEEYERTGDNRDAVARGLELSGPLVTTAAAILALTFLAYLSSGVVFLKMLGLGTALAIIVDATLIRAILVPSSMRLAGELNWWTPTPLRRFYERFGISES